MGLVNTADIIELDAERGVKLDATCMDRSEATRAAYQMGLQMGQKAAYKDGHDAGAAEAAQVPRETTAGEELDLFMQRMKDRGTRGYRGDFVAKDGTRIHLEVEFERPRSQGQSTPEYDRG